MYLSEAKQRFIELWGTLGAEWGINRTMAQIHALLLVSAEPLSTDEVLEELGISRGNANMNLRELVGWGLVSRQLKQGERKEFFAAQKDVWQMAQRIAAERRKRELDPMMRCLEELLRNTSAKAGEENELKRFTKLVGDIHSLGKKGNILLEMLLKLDQTTFFKPLLRVFKL